MLLWLGYLDYPAAEVEKVLAAGGKAVTLTASDGPTDDSRININGHWDKWDSAVNVAGLPVRILPTSGVVQTPQWYALMAEALKDFRAARADRQVKGAGGQEHANAAQPPSRTSTLPYGSYMYRSTTAPDVSTSTVTLKFASVQ